MLSVVRNTVYAVWIIVLLPAKVMASGFQVAHAENFGRLYDTPIGTDEQSFRVILTEVLESILI